MPQLMRREHNPAQSSDKILTIRQIHVRSFDIGSKQWRVFFKHCFNSVRSITTHLHIYAQLFQYVPKNLLHLYFGSAINKLSAIFSKVHRKLLISRKLFI